MKSIRIAVAAVSALALVAATRPGSRVPADRTPARFHPARVVTTASPVRCRASSACLAADQFHHPAASIAARGTPPSRAYATSSRARASTEMVSSCTAPKRASIAVTVRGASRPPASPCARTMMSRASRAPSSMPEAGAVAVPVMAHSLPGEPGAGGPGAFRPRGRVPMIP